MVDVALRGVVRTCIAQVAEDGFTDNHHFYITFQTGHPGINIPDHLHANHPKEMTIVLQFQYWGLEVGDEAFSVTLSFNRHHERLTIPFDSLISFVDPSVKFGLQFTAGRVESGGVTDAPLLVGDATAGSKASDQTATNPRPESDDAAVVQGDAAAGDNGEIVHLDTFRKRK